MPQAAALVEQEHRSKYRVELGFDQQHQLIKNVLQRRARRDHFQNVSLPVAEDVGPLAGGDIVGDAEQAESLAVRIAKGNLCRGHPFAGAGGIDNEFLLVDHRFSAAQYSLFAIVKTARHLRGMEIEIGQADHVAGLFPPAVGGKRLVGDHEAAIGALDP